MPELGIKKATTLQLASPGNRVIGTHRFATPFFKILSDRFVGVFIHTQSNLHAFESRHRLRVVGPICGIPEVFSKSFDRGMVHCSGIDEYSGFEKC